ncbi:MAG: DUF1566 domain-containing protein [Nitrospira sp.]|nr:DUF1566 domain-containing protein [Nitrospira sp.]
MMRSIGMSRLSRIEAVMLIAGLPLAGSGIRDASAASPMSEEILAKVDQILTTLGGVQDGNHTLRWDRNLPAAQRFVILPAFNNQAVLDKNTGLVWERSPATTVMDWRGTRVTCANNNTGGQKGWRLPSFAELSSLVDPSVAPGPTLPPGHPFLNVESGYWSASSDADDPTRAWFVNFNFGNVNTFGKAATSRAWCVRGGINADQY